MPFGNPYNDIDSIDAHYSPVEVSQEEDFNTSNTFQVDSNSTSFTLANQSEVNLLDSINQEAGSNSITNGNGHAKDSENLSNSTITPGDLEDSKSGSNFSQLNISDVFSEITDISNTTITWENFNRSSNNSGLSDRTPTRESNTSKNSEAEIIIDLPSCEKGKRRASSPQSSNSNRSNSSRIDIGFNSTPTKHFSKPELTAQLASPASITPIKKPVFIESTTSEAGTSSLHQIDNTISEALSGSDTPDASPTKRQKTDFDQDL
jgi:hypothetical protein